MITDPTDGKPGLRIETAASVTAQNMIRDHLGKFAPAIMRDHGVAKSVHAEYTSGLAGVIALLIASGQGSQEDVFNGTIEKLREYVARDLRFMGRKS